MEDEVKEGVTNIRDGLEESDTQDAKTIMYIEIHTQLHNVLQCTTVY